MRKIDKYIAIYARFLKENGIKVETALMSIFQDRKLLPTDFHFYTKIPVRLKRQWRETLSINDSFRKEIEQLFYMFLKEKGLTEQFLFNFNSIEGIRWRRRYGYRIDFNDYIRTIHNPTLVISEAFEWTNSIFSQQDEYGKIVTRENTVDWYLMEDEFSHFIRTKLYENQ